MIKIISKGYAFIVVAVLLSTVAANAACPKDTTGLGANAFAGLPNGSVNAPRARTLEDFVKATANELFFTEAGQDWLYSDVMVPLFGPLGPLGGLFNQTTPPIAIHGHACNDIGQCRNISVQIEFEPAQDGIANELIQFVTDGRIDGVNTDWTPSNYGIVASDGAGSSTDVIGFDTTGITSQANLEDTYDLSTDGQSNIGTGCRDNQGNPIGGAGGGEAPSGNAADGMFNYDLSTLSQSIRTVWECWQTPSGVACRQVD